MQCNGNDRERWTNVLGKIHLTQHPEWCLGRQSVGSEKLANLELHPCDSAEAETWHLDDRAKWSICDDKGEFITRIELTPGACFEVDGEERNGARVILHRLESPGHGDAAVWQP